MKRKILRLHLRGKDNSGIILVVVLWILVILTTMAVSLGRNTQIELALAKNAIAKAQAKYFAVAGMIYAMNQIRLDSKDEKSQAIDTLYYCGVPSGQNTPTEELFQHRPLLGGGYFDVRYHPAGAEDSSEYYYGPQDEDRRININALNAQNANIFISLLTSLGIETETASTIAYSIIDWKDADSTEASERYGAEDTYYMGLTPAYHCKNLPFESLEELLLVKGMTKEIFHSLRPYITIFPKDGAWLRINIDTASATVLRAVARSVAGAATNTQESDADSLVEKILDYRRGADGKEFTSDDKEVEINDLGLNEKENVIFLVLNQYRTKTADYLRVNVRGVEDSRKVESHISAVVKREDLSIVYWKRY